MGNGKNRRVKWGFRPSEDDLAGVEKNVEDVK